MVAAYLMASSKGTVKADEAAKLARTVGTRERRDLAQHLNANPADHVKLVSLMNPAQMQEVAKEIPVQHRTLDGLISQGLNGREVNFDGQAAPNGSAFQQMANWNPNLTSDREEASLARDYWTSMNETQFAKEMVDHKMITPEEAKNPYLVGGLHGMMSDRLSTLNPNTEEGVRAIANVKNFIDAHQHYMSNQ
jgi:hypothetical protein